MGTRGFVGFIVDDETKVMYNHYDSHPSGVGVGVLEWIKAAGPAGIDQMREAARRLVMVHDEWESYNPPVCTPVPPLPTGAEAERLAKYADPSVGNWGMTNTEVRNWHQQIRRAEGDLTAILEAGYMTDSSTFPLDGLFCEWGYLIDLDARTFEVYRGFHKGEVKGRWASQAGSSDGYSPVSLLASWPLGEGLPEEDEFIEKTEKLAYGEDDDE